MHTPNAFIGDDVNLITMNGYHIRGTLLSYTTGEESNTDSSYFTIRDTKDGIVKMVFEHAVSTIELVGEADQKEVHPAHSCAG